MTGLSVQNFCSRKVKVLPKSEVKYDLTTLPLATLNYYWPGGVFEELRGSPCLDRDKKLGKLRKSLYKFDHDWIVRGF